MAMAVKLSLSLLFGVLITIIITMTEASNIAVYGGPGHGSHFIVAASLGEELVRRGHNVTAIISGEAIAVSNDERYSNIFHFAITNRRFSEEKVKEKLDFIARAAVSGNFIGEVMKNMETMREELIKDCDSLLLEDDFINILVEANLDILILDPYFGCANLLPEILKKPVIFMLPTHIEEYLAWTMGSPINAAIHPSFGSGFPLRMTFWQRLRNFIQVNIIPSFVAMVSKGIQEYSSLRNISPYSSATEILSRAELFLVNMDFAVEFPLPISPNVIPVGGITTKPAKQLDQNLEDFVESSGEDGVIIFSMGSYATYMKEELIQEFVTAFSRLPQKVVWKSTRDLPKGADQTKIKIMPWLPQNDLLAHNKTKLIIYQGGNNCFYEVVYHGVPSVVIPLLQDQFDVASRTVHHGMGVQLDYHTLDVDKIEAAVRTVLGNNSYKENTARISSMYGHRTMRPVEKAAFWVEYVIQFGGSHLKSVAGELTWYQYHLIDVILFLSICLAIIFIILLFVLRLTVKLFCNVFWKNRKANAKKTE